MGELLNLVGLSTGVVLYTMLLIMVLRAGRTPSVHARVDPLLVITSLLGLVWNVCALPAYELSKIGIAGPLPALIAIGFGALGLLPAVVVHSVLRGERRAVAVWWGRTIVGVAYVTSGMGAILHVYAAGKGWAVPSPAGMRLLTYVFVALIVPLVALTRGQPGARRALWAAALATFAVSALHLAEFHRGNSSWPVELLGHHASVPIALAILYQDYPFALADLFLKRALSLLAIVTLAFVTIATFGARSVAFAEFIQRDPAQVGVLVTVWVGAALLYAPLQRQLAWLVDAIILSRPDYVTLRATITRKAQEHDDVPGLLHDLCELLAPALSARAVTWQEWYLESAPELLAPIVIVGADAVCRLPHPRDGALPASTLEPAAAVVIVPTAEAPRYLIHISELTGGRRFLSDDLGNLEAIAIVVARRIDAIRMTDERYDREIREQEMGRLASEAELRALRAQVNPHFLFNALTTIGYLIQVAPPRALHTLLRLTALLRAVLRSEGELTTLGREVELVEAYLDIERARFEDRLRVTIDVAPELRHMLVPPLVLQPVVENAVKHGIAPLVRGGSVTVRATFEPSADTPGELRLFVHDTGAGATPAALERGRLRGLGLQNVERRLAGQYGRAASLSIHTMPNEGTTVEIRLPVSVKATAEPELQQVVT